MTSNNSPSITRKKWMEADPGTGAWRDIHGRWNATRQPAIWSVMIDGQSVGDFSDETFKSHRLLPNRQGNAVVIHTTSPSDFAGKSRWAQVKAWLLRLAAANGTDSLVDRCRATNGNDAGHALHIWTWKRENRLSWAEQG